MATTPEEADVLCLKLYNWFAIQAMEEAQGHRVDAIPKCDELAGTCKVNGTTHKLLFPHSLLRAVETRRCPTAQRGGSIFFQGSFMKQGPRHNFIKSISRNESLRNSSHGQIILIDSSYGMQAWDRLGVDKEVLGAKFRLDEAYFTKLCCTAFALTPINFAPWSYRFFEAIACGALPVLSLGERDIFSDSFHHLRYPRDAFAYNESATQQNLDTFERLHTLPVARRSTWRVQTESEKPKHVRPRPI